MLTSQYQGLLQEKLRELHFSSNTRRAYTRWVGNLLTWSRVTDSSEITPQLASEFLTHLCVRERVSPSTQNQAFCAISFFMKHILLHTDDIPEFQRSSLHEKNLGVLRQSEAKQVFGLVAGRALLIGQLMYYAGLKLHEVLNMRIRDLDFRLLRIAVRDCGETHYTILPPELKDILERRVAAVKKIHIQDMHEEMYIEIHGAFSKCSKENVDWQYVFPGTKPEWSEVQQLFFRPQFSASPVYKAYRRAFTSLGLQEHVTCHSLRHSFGVRMVKAGYSIATIGRLMGHKDRRSTKVYEHWLQQQSFSS